MKIDQKYINIGFIVFVFILLNAFIKEYIFNDISIGFALAALISILLAYGLEFITRKIKYSVWVRIVIIIGVVISMRIYSM